MADESDDRERWDAKYRGERGERRDPPVEFVRRCLERLGPGTGRRAVDLAAGTGRHTFELIERGWTAEAWDVSPVALEILGARTAEAGLSVETRAIDLLLDELPPARFELAVVVSFLDRPFLVRIQELVVPGGFLVYSAPTLDFPGEKPPMKWRFRPGELDGGIPGFETLLFEERGGRAQYLGRRIA